MKTFHDHETAGHPGEIGTYNAVQQHYWWPGLRTFVKNYVHNTRHVDGRVQNGTARLRATEARYQTARVRSKQLVVLSIQVNNYT